jgi:serine/threonine protein kinase/tetratricopeptide (TPR) repeat protein
MAADPLLNSTVGGCLIEQVIGQGGMGVIYKARQKSLDRIIALKVLAPHLANDINFVARFQREARAIARVNHPNILAVYDVGDDQNTNYMIMELIDGQSLAEMQSDRQGALPWQESLNYVKQAAQGLEAAQAAGIIHRDIKPENLMVTKKGIIKVSDFGLAKEADASNTSIDAVMGTPAFMSPEQCDGKKVDGRSDIYSLGGTFYRLITGRLPFEAETAMSMMYRHKHEALIPPHEVVPSLSPSISAIIVKMMAKKREHRYQSMTEVIDALELALKGGTQPAVMNSPLPSAPSHLPVPPVSSAARMIEAQLPPLPAIPLADGDTGVIHRHDPVSGISGRGSAQSGRLPVTGTHIGFASPADSSRMNVPSGALGIASAGMAVPDDAYTNVARGDEMLGRGDRLGALKCFRAALQFNTLDAATRTRIEQEVRKEAQTRRAAAESMLKKGMLVEASRECRVLVELDPTDDAGRAMLKDIDHKLTLKRTVVNDIRTALATSQYDRALKIWDTTPTELRDEALGKQIEGVRSTTLPSIKLAEQGDSFGRQGRLEEAISTYEDALKINPMCEPARMGLKDAQQKVQRIEHMLKEGYQFSLDQNYSKAIETWKPILQLRPGHPQAVKSMIDAYVAYAQHLRSQGDIEGAWLAYKGACETDPHNKTIRRSYEELTNLRDKEQALMDRAHDSAAHNRLSEAIGYWKEVKRVNPASRRATQQMQQLAKQRSGGLLKLLIVLVIIAAAAGAGYQYYTETKALEVPRQHLDALRATETLDIAHGMMQKLRFDEMMRDLEGEHFLLKKTDAQSLLNDGKFWLRVDEAILLEQNNKLMEAEKLNLELAKEVNQERTLSEKLRTRAIGCKMRRLDKAAASALAARDWGLMKQAYSDMQAELQQPTAPESIKKDYPDTAKKILFALRMQSALRYEGEDVEKAAAEFTTAQAIQAELKFPGIDDYITERLQRIGFDDKKYQEAMAAGKAAFLKGNYALAKEQYGKAADYKKVKERPAVLVYVEDTIECDKRGMSLYAMNNPIRGDSTWTSDRKTAYCIDRYEYPNAAGGMPKAGVSWAEADTACRNSGKRLCARNEWIDACRGGERNTEQYPYGNTPDPAKCNTGGNAAVASGSKSGCKNALGTYDMSGNLAEWVDAEPDGVSVMGGSYTSAVGQAMCDQREMLKRNAPADNRHGFRCCRALEPLPDPDAAQKN